MIIFQTNQLTFFRLKITALTTGIFFFLILQIVCNTKKYIKFNFGVLSFHRLKIDSSYKTSIVHNIQPRKWNGNDSYWRTKVLPLEKKLKITRINGTPKTSTRMENRTPRAKGNSMGFHSEAVEVGWVILSELWNLCMFTFWESNR